MATAGMDFYSDWIAILKGELALVGYPVPAAVDGQEICFRYFNYRKRAIDPRPWAVLESAELTIPPDLQAGYAAVKAKIESGAELRPHLSRRLTDPEYDDPMLNDWGMHHLHLSSNLEADGFVTRTGPLLYARVLEDRVLCLQILAHANWTNRQLIEIWYKNWPQTLEQYRLKGFSAAVPQPTDAELKQLRQGHVFTLLQMPDGCIFAPPGGGVATSGLSAQVVTDCDWHAHQLKRLEKHVNENIGRIVTAAKEDGVTLPGNSKFRLHVHNGSFVAVEESTQWGFILFNPK